MKKSYLPEELLESFYTPGWNLFFWPKVGVKVPLIGLSVEYYGYDGVVKHQVVEIVPDSHMITSSPVATSRRIEWGDIDWNGFKVTKRSTRT